MSSLKVTRNDRPAAAGPVCQSTASGNNFTAQVVRSGDPQSLGLNLAAPEAGANYKVYIMKVRYEDTNGTFAGADQINVNATSNEVRRNFGKGQKPDRTGQATGSALQRTGPNTFEGEVEVVLKGHPGKDREDVKSVGFTFGQFTEPNSWANAKFDGKPWQEYRVPMHLKGPQ
jgi:hypothetical protein